MKDQYFSQIKALIERNGPMGVNSLQKELNIPLSSMQRYMEKQTYFKKNDQRKWDLPERAANNEISSAIDNFDTVIESQLSGINAMFEMLTSQMKAAITLLGAQKPVMHPVADNSVKIHPRLLKINDNATLMIKAIKQYKDNVPEEYLEILQNVSWTDLCVDLGAIYYQNTLGSELTDLLTGNKDKLSEEILIVLEKYQIKED